VKEVNVVKFFVRLRGLLSLPLFFIFDWAETFQFDQLAGSVP
jgi:hypothetical protein